MQHKVREYKLAGGARLLAISIPNTITFFWSSTFRAGYRYVPTKQYELPHLAEHLAFEGTKSYPDSLVFKVEVERDGTYYNASTDFDSVSYIYAGSHEELGRIIPLNLSQIYEPLYRPEQVEQEKQVITQEMSRKREDDGWRLGYLALHRLLPRRNPDIEQRIANIAKLTPDDLASYHERYYGAANTAFILAGDYSQREIEAQVERLNRRLNEHTPGRAQQLAKLEYHQPGGEIQAFEPYHRDQGLFGLQFSLDQRDELNHPALLIMATMLTGGLSARLQRKARQAGLTYGVSAGAGTHHDHTIFALHSQTSLNKLEPLVKLAAGELAAIGTGDYSDDELVRAIGFSVGRVRRAHQTPAAYADWYGERFVMGEELESPERWVERIEAVDRAAIQRAYQRYVKYDTSLLTLIGAGLPAKTKRYQSLLEPLFAG